jgi:hypothetical protein
VCVGFDDPEDFGNLTPRDRRNIRSYAQATSTLLSALSAQEYNRVSGLEIAKEIWDILHITHEGVDKVKKSKINILMAELNRFTIFDGEGSQEMFDRLMVIVGKIRGLGGDELDDHFVVKVMSEAFAPRNPTLVTLIREKKTFEEFSPNDVLRRILTHELMDREIHHRKKIGELEAKLNNLKVKDVALHANKSSKPSTSSKPSKSKSKKVEVESCTSDSSEDEDESPHVEIEDMVLFMKTYKKGLKKQGYKLAKKKFPNKKKRTCYNCGSTEHFIADCPNEKRENKNDKGKGSYKKDQTPHHKRRNYGGEAHIGHERNSGGDSSNEGEGKKNATVAIKKPPSTSRLFDNLTDDQESSSIRCFMAKGEKVKTRSKPSPPPSDKSEMDSSDEEVNQLVSDMDKQSRDSMAKLVVELEKTQDILTADRSELEALRLEVSLVESIIATLKEDLSASQAQCNSLKSRNEELEEQYSLLWSSTSHPSKVKCDSSASTSKGGDRCCNIDLESQATNLGNMEAMKKEIATLNTNIARGCMSEGNKKRKAPKRKIMEKSEKPGFGSIEGGKTNERKIIKEKECLEFKSTGFLFTQIPEVPTSKPGGPGVWKPRATQLGEPRGSGEIPGGSGVCKDRTKKKGKAQRQHVLKASNTSLRVQNHPVMPRRNLAPKRTRLMHLATYSLAMS